MWAAYIYCVGMPSHTSSEAQPADKVFFCPVKRMANLAMDEYIVDAYAAGNPDATFAIWDLPPFMEQGIREGSAKWNTISGFVECGIFPLDLEWTSRPHNQAKLRISDPLKVVLTEADEDGRRSRNVEMYFEMYSCVAAARVAFKLSQTGGVSER